MVKKNFPDQSFIGLTMYLKDGGDGRMPALKSNLLSHFTTYDVYET